MGGFCEDVFMSTYRIEGLPPTEFEHLLGRDGDVLRRQGVVRVRADRKPGFPCRVTLEDAEPGESCFS